MRPSTDLDRLAEELGLIDNRATELFKPLIQLLAAGDMQRGSAREPVRALPHRVFLNRAEDVHG